MNTPFTFETEQFEFGSPAETEESNAALWEIGSPDRFEDEGEIPVAPAAPPALSAAAIARAIVANRVFARQFGWGCVIAGNVQPIPEVLTVLGLAAGATERDLAQAIARWQQAQFGRPGDGQLGPRSWAQIQRVAPAGFPAPRFKRAAWDVIFGGQKLGVLEKTAPYEQCYLDPADSPWTGSCRPQPTVNTDRAGTRIQLGFRISNMDAVRRAGFVHPDGEPHFNFTQMIETNRPLVADPIVRTIRRYRRYIDPTVIARDNNPYFWDEPAPGDIARNIHRIAADAVFPRASRLCYDVIFWDFATRALADANPPGLGLYWNAEVVLVGIRAGKRNMALNSVKWGFDIRPAANGPAIHLNALVAGPFGGSATFRQILGQEIRAGINFPGHCFVGSGFGQGAICT